MHQVVHKITETLPKLQDGFFWRVNTQALPVNPGDPPALVHVELRRKHWLHPNTGRLMAEAWYEPLPGQVPEGETPQTVAQRLAADLLEANQRAVGR